MTESVSPAEVPAETPKTKPTITTKKVVKEGFKLVTAAQDLRVVTKDFVVFRLQGGKPTQVHEAWAFEAQRAGAEQKINVTFE